MLDLLIKNLDHEENKNFVDWVF